MYTILLILLLPIFALAELPAQRGKADLEIGRDK